MTTVQPTTVSEKKRVARTVATGILRVEYEDGSGDLTGVVLREPHGLTIAGGGTIPSPLTVEIAADRRLVPLAHLEQALALIEDMSRFVGQMALRDYAAFNEAPMNLRAAIGAKMAEA